MTIRPVYNARHGPSGRMDRISYDKIFYTLCNSCKKYVNDPNPRTTLKCLNDKMFRDKKTDGCPWARSRALCPYWQLEVGRYVDDYWGDMMSVHVKGPSDHPPGSRGTV